VFVNVQRAREGDVFAYGIRIDQIRARTSGLQRSP